MIRVAGRKNVVGSPFLYRTTKDFLVHFGLNDIRDLPRLEEFGDLIGESINDDLVAAINAAEPGTDNIIESEAAPIDAADAEDRAGDIRAGDVSEAADDDQASVTVEESQLESSSREANEE